MHKQLRGHWESGFSIKQLYKLNIDFGELHKFNIMGRVDIVAEALPETRTARLKLKKMHNKLQLFAENILSLCK